jgi:hypothetical protein
VLPMGWPLQKRLVGPRALFQPPSGNFAQPEIILDLWQRNLVKGD